MANFYSDLERGKSGEKRVAAALAARGHKVEDVSNNPFYQFDYGICLYACTYSLHE